MSAERDPSRRRWWKPEFISSWGLSSTFRVYLFLGSIAAGLVFLLYNEALIHELKEQERDRAALYAYLHAFAASATIPEEQAAVIFQEIINNPKADLTIITTNHRGEVILWKGRGLPEAGDVSPSAKERLRRLVEQMDARNSPIAYYESAKVKGYLHRDGDNFIIADSDRGGEIAAWAGRDLPAPEDTSAAARAQVREALGRMGEKSAPQAFEIPTRSFSYLHYDGSNLVVTDHTNRLMLWAGRDLPAPEDTSAAARAQVREALGRMGEKSAPQAFEIPTIKYIHYGDSDLVSRFSLAPIVLTGVIGLFFLIGYIGFRNIRRSEQRSIWVGMAKETAHQLGTPLSSLSGWLELIAGEVQQSRNPPQAMARVGRMVRETQKDLRRLNQIASRFSQIGSVPELKVGEVQAVLRETINYFKNRGPQFGRHRIEVQCREVPPIPLNEELMGWVFENLFKNAMDAIGRKAGEIAIHLEPLPGRKAVRISFRDNGRGIEPEHLGRVFEPGFSTKKRGWGLGLSFVKRIVEEYHRGSIAVVHSAPGEGTNFEIILPMG